MAEIIQLKEKILCRGLKDAAPEISRIILSSSRFTDCLVPAELLQSSPSLQNDNEVESSTELDSKEPSMQISLGAAEHFLENKSLSVTDYARLIAGAFWNCKRMHLIIDGHQRRQINRHLGPQLLQSVFEYVEEAVIPIELSSDLTVDGLIADGSACYDSYHAKRAGDKLTGLQQAQSAIVEDVLAILKVNPNELD